MSTFEKIADLPITIESYELEDHDREYPGGFTRPSTTVRLHGGGEDGVGEDVVYTVLDHIGHRDAGPVLDLTGPSTLREFCELIGGVDLFTAAPPEREASRHYRRWAYESAALDLALRQHGLPLHEALGRDPQPLRFVCSTRLTTLRTSDAGSNTEPIRKRLAKYPSLEFKLDPENDWDAGSDRRDRASLPRCGSSTSRASTAAPRSTSRPTRSSTGPWPRRFPRPTSRTPTSTTRRARCSSRTSDRVTWDALLHSLADLSALEPAPKAINSKPSRFGSIEELFSVYDHCERDGIAIYGGGQGELSAGRGQIQYLASLFHADTPNDVAPSGYNDPSVPDGLAVSPMDPLPSATGFRWAE